VKVCNFREVEADNEVPGVALRTVISAQDGAPHFAMRVLEVEPGASTPFHAHAHEHEVFILEGQAKVKSADGERALQPNDVVFVAGEEEHCFVNTGPQVLRFICCIPHPETLSAARPPTRER
jgi:quercetin dioxygenase-like cupin family protein